MTITRREETAGFKGRESKTQEAKRKWDRWRPYRTSGWPTMRWVNTVVILWCTAAYLEALRPVDAISGGCLKFSLCSHLSPFHLAVNLSHNPHSHLSSHNSWLRLLSSSLITYVAEKRKCRFCKSLFLEIKWGKKSALFSQVSHTMSLRYFSHAFSFTSLWDFISLVRCLIAP